MLKISKTYEVVTEESAEQGDFEETGFVFKDQPCGFRELIETIEHGGFCHSDSSHGVPRWLYTESEVNYRTGEYTSYALHPARDKQSMRYWDKAMAFLGYK